MCIVPRIINEPTIMATRPPTMNTKNFPISLILANTNNSFYCNYNCLKNSIRFNSVFMIFYDMSKPKQIAAWIGIIGGMIGFFFLSIEMAAFMR